MSAPGEAAPGRRELVLDFPADHRDVRVARSLVRRFARLEGLDDESVEGLLLVASELLANAIDHVDQAPARNGGSRMRLDVVLDPERWTVRVTDEGSGDPEELRRLLQQTVEPDLEDERGRGLFLLAQLTDVIEVERNAGGRGLTIVATKRHAAG